MAQSGLYKIQKKKKKKSLVSDEEKTRAKDATTDRTKEANILIPHQDLLASTTKTKREEWNRIWTTTNRTKIHDIAHQKIPNITI